MKTTKILLLICSSLLVSSNTFGADLIHFWDEPQHGGNSFNRLPPDQAYFEALRQYHASWVRLAYGKWKSKERDFLIGDADDYQGLVKSDLNTLKSVIGRAHKAGLKVVVTPLSLPLARWSQNNGGKTDSRLWQSKGNWQVAAKFWRDLAAELKNTPGIAAYNIINEPTPEKGAGLAEHATVKQMQAWYAKHKGGARDLPLFYETIIRAIRSVDPLTPIMVDAGWYAAADDFSYWPKPLSDKRVLYSFHMYEPYAATSGPNLRRKHPYVYPGKVPFGDGAVQLWDAKRVAQYLTLPVNWAREQKIPMNRLVAGEFGCVRKMNSCKQYLTDVLTVLDQYRLHWAFYSFREDSWDAMNYELGPSKMLDGNIGRPRKKESPIL
ncbi:glycoside hydrolase family 5 protein [Dongshaea marina]|uniref:glycoside hydrolase family 5 protein n=1 Tax=Dongshaea marina TaxID=2047966 RepID=UPI0019027F09|nr:cellulase family glycosylhydrolase [Dongshaea marina]